MQVLLGKRRRTITNDARGLHIGNGCILFAHELWVCGLFRCEAMMEEHFTRLANEIVEALCRWNLSAYEWRVLMCIFRKTYGYQKKEDWIAPSQIVAMTGIHKAHVSRALRLLKLRNLVTPRGNSIGFNKYSSQWRQLPRGVTSHSKLPRQTTSLPNRAPRLPDGAPKLPNGADTKETITKETLQKKAPAKSFSDEQVRSMEGNFKRIAVEHQWCDVAYTEKTWGQSRLLRPDNRREFYRKVTLMLTWARLPKQLGRAKLLFHEIASFVNDRGHMERVLSDKEVAERRTFAEQEGGRDYVAQES